MAINSPGFMPDMMYRPDRDGPQPTQNPPGTRIMTENPFANSMGLLGPTQFPSQPTGGFPRSGYHHPDLPPPGFVDPATQVFNAAPENVTDYWDRIAQFYGHDDAGMGDPNSIGQSAPNMGVTDVATGLQDATGAAQPQQAMSQPRPSAEDDYYGWLGPWDNRNMRGTSGFEVQREREGGGFDPVYADGDSFDLQPGDRFVTTGYDSADMGAPGQAEGGRWMFAGTRHIDGPAVSGTDEMGNQAVYQTDWEWMPDPAPQQSAPQQPPPPQQEPETTPQQWDPNRLYDDDDYFTNISRRSVEGTNRSSFVGPPSTRYGINTGQTNWADMPFDPLLGMDLLYPNFHQGWQDNMIDPFDGEQLQLQLAGNR